MATDTDSRISALLGEASEKWVREVVYRFRFYEKYCESEIERVLMAALLCAGELTWWGDFEMYASPAAWLDGPANGADGTETYPRAIEAAPQCEVLGYRVDFLFRSWSWEKSVWEMTVVECDGHDFHERTKEQAERDRRRDREMIAAGYRVLRFTGREIWRDPLACAAQILAIVRGVSVAAVVSLPDGSL